MNDVSTIFYFFNMKTKYQGLYRISSARLTDWDYGSNGIYFITICTQHRVPYFGKIEHHAMHCNVLGELAKQYWLDIPKHFNFVVMPNHVHGILIINKKNLPEMMNLPVETRLIASLPPTHGGFSGNKNPMLNDNISKIIRWYKGRCSFEMRKHHADFQWQARFYDRIVRDAEAHERVNRYIENNPGNWKEDKMFKK